jgi:hypothetical protein
LKHTNEIVEESYTVTIVRNEVTGTVLREEWRNSKGELHRVGGPAKIERSRAKAGSESIEERWYEYGRCHRDDGPAVIYRDAGTGKVTSTSWYVNGTWIPCRERRPSQRQSHQTDFPTPSG